MSSTYTYPAHSKKSGLRNAASRPCLRKKQRCLMTRRRTEATVASSQCIMTHHPISDQNKRCRRMMTNIPKAQDSAEKLEIDSCCTQKEETKTVMSQALCHMQNLVLLRAACLTTAYVPTTGRIDTYIHTVRRDLCRKHRIFTLVR